MLFDRRRTIFVSILDELSINYVEKFFECDNLQAKQRLSCIGTLVQQLMDSPSEETSTKDMRRNLI